MKIVMGLVLVYAYVFSILGLTGFLKKKFNISDNSSRKIVHVMVSFCFLITYYFLGYSWFGVIPPFSFVILNYISYKKDTFNMMEIHEGEKTLGTVYYAISFFILAVISCVYNNFMIPYGIGVFCMAFGDGFAAIVGRFFVKYNIKLINNKTLAGTLTTFIFSFGVALIMNYIFKIDYNIIEITLIGIASALLELCSAKGYDNLTVPLFTALISYVLL